MNWLDPILIFILAGVVTGILVPVISSMCFRYGFLDMPGEHKRHRRPTPNLGGIAIFAAFWASVAVAAKLYPELADEMGPFGYYVVAGSIITFLVGLIDDLSDLSAIVKLTAQIATGMILFYGGVKISILYIPFLGPVELGYWSLPITLIWTVGVTNCINLIDGLDGLAAGVSAIAALALWFVGVIFNLATVIIFCSAIIGATLVFLYSNHYPARIFMGDSGSLFLGYLFAVISILFPIKSYTTAAVYIPLLALAVPIIETVVSFVRRTAAGKKFYKADNRHLFHYLEASGLSKAQVVWLFYGLSAVFAVSSGAMYIFDKRIVMTILVVFMVVIFVILFRFRLAYVRKNGKNSYYG